jgi:type I restriction enzyme S subunit
MSEKLPKGWKRVKLGEVAVFENGKARPKTKGNIPIYGGNGILGYCDKFNSDGETIIIGRVGAYCGSVFYENSPIWISDNALSAKPRDKNNSKYLYYLLKYLDLNQFALGSSHPLITKNLLNSLNVLITTCENEQKAIASVLSTLDDKIDLLHRQNQTLEQMAQTLYEYWISDLDFNSTLKDIITIQNGFAFKSRDFKSSGNHRVIKIKNISGNIVDINSTDFVSNDIVSKIDKRFKINSGDILIAMTGAEIGKMGIVPQANESLWLNQRVGLLKEKFIGSRFLAYLHLKSDYGADYIENTATGSAQPNISATGIESCEFPKLSNKQLESYSKQLNLLFNKIIYNLGQIHTLEKLRDTLLPKLMSGEIRIKNA